MKKFSTLCLTAAMAVTLFSCSKDDETPTYKKSDFIGTWEIASSSGGEYNLCADKKDYIIIGEESVTSESFDDDCRGMGKGEFSYTYDKNKLTIMQGLAIYKIINLTATELKVEETSLMTESKVVKTFSKK